MRIAVSDCHCTGYCNVVNLLDRLHHIITVIGSGVDVEHYDFGPMLSASDANMKSVKSSCSVLSYCYLF